MVNEGNYKNIVKSMRPIDTQCEEKVASFLDAYFYPRLSVFNPKSSELYVNGRPTNYIEQLKGKDMSGDWTHSYDFVRPGQRKEYIKEEFIIDEKCAAYWIDQKLNSFILELLQTNKNNQTQLGWYLAHSVFDESINDSLDDSLLQQENIYPGERLETTHYLFCWIETKGNSFRSDSKDKIRLRPYQLKDFIKNKEIGKVNAYLINKKFLQEFFRKGGLSKQWLFKISILAKNYQRKVHENQKWTFNELKKTFRKELNELKVDNYISENVTLYVSSPGSMKEALIFLKVDNKLFKNLKFYENLTFMVKTPSFTITKDKVTGPFFG